MRAARRRGRFSPRGSRSPGFSFYMALDELGVGRNNLAALRQLLQAGEFRRTLRLAPEGLADRLRKFDRQRGLQADQRHAGLAVLEADLHAVGGMRIDDG